MPESIRPDETLDGLRMKKVGQLVQKKKGYRLSMDPLLLANFVTVKRHETLLDIGTGCGIIPVYLSRKGIENRIVGIEIQDELYDLALRNKELNGCANVAFVKGDVRTAGKDLGTFHVIVSNPPYVKERTGRKSPGQSRLLARYESALDLPSLWLPPRTCLRPVGQALRDLSGRQAGRAVVHGEIPGSGAEKAPAGLFKVGRAGRAFSRGVHEKRWGEPVGRAAALHICGE